jgi:lipoate-protein ligase A
MNDEEPVRSESSRRRHPYSSLIPPRSPLSSSFIPHPSSLSPCRLILDAPASGAWNMAVDEWLLQRAPGVGESSFRLYRWVESTLSLGYFQRYEDREQHLPSLGGPVVRRISGGGAILHDHEWTYCLVVPGSHPLSIGRQALYRAVHQSIVEALGDLGIAASLCAGTPSAGDPQPFLCFQRRVPGDVVIGDVKVAGSAQRRIRGAVLQHGSLLLARSASAPELPGLRDQGLTAADEGRMIDQWLEKLSGRLRLAWQPAPLSDGERSEIARLVEAKYGSPRWTQDRGRGRRPELL